MLLCVYFMPILVLLSLLIGLPLVFLDFQNSTLRRFFGCQFPFVSTVLWEILLLSLRSEQAYTWTAEQGPNG